MGHGLLLGREYVGPVAATAQPAPGSNDRGIISIASNMASIHE
ncbi:hypothetical protein GGE45_001583 [Rhizobium aethiopicum]|uniref:Uncharacterized protein n=1 Tax=Rhizobium aethiopicum TaxID=1138170 RepID=A0A7W6MIA1_9HYPH|nr:hypothetical protein [Rhizobium aethiopicum]MBB4579259.1 hypothetical protein [Rhizobium aethiopicum]